mgnify:CR=1 FL=1
MELGCTIPLGASAGARPPGPALRPRAGGIPPKAHRPLFRRCGRALRHPHPRTAGGRLSQPGLGGRDRLRPADRPVGIIAARSGPCSQPPCLPLHRARGQRDSLAVDGEGPAQPQRYSRHRSVISPWVFPSTKARIFSNIPSPRAAFGAITATPSTMV